MAKRTTKTTQSSPQSAAKLKRYLQRQEYSQALPLALEAVQSSPSAENYEYLRQCYLWMIRATSPSEAVLQQMLHIPGTNDYWEKLAIAFAGKGDYPRAKELAERVPGSSAMRPVLAHLADWAMTQRSEVAKPKIPEELHAGLDTIQLAYAQYEKKQDEAARETLNAIGLSSPWLEWKLLIRGLLAWSAGDNTRALENWSRLQTDRAPYRFAAPLRQTIDRSFVQSLKPQQLKFVQKQAGRLFPKIDELYQIREILGSEQLTPAIEKAQRLLSDLQTASPDLPAKLTQLFYWEIVGCGQPRDMKLLQRHFPLPREDQQFYRLQALVTEQLHDHNEAHAFWNKYQQWIEQTPSAWPPKQAPLARAMVFARMGEAASRWLHPSLQQNLPDFITASLLKPGKRKPLNPSSLECFEKAYSLAPEQPIAAIMLLTELAKTDPPRARVFAREIRARFPHHLPTLKAILKFHELFKDSEQIHEVVRQLATIDPLDRQWQARLAQSTFEETWQQALQGVEGAMAALERAAAHLGNTTQYQVQGLKTALACQKDTEAAAALLAHPSSERLARFYATLAEGIRLRMPKKKWEPLFHRLLDEIRSSPSIDELYPLLELMGYYRSPDQIYRGYPAQVKELSKGVQARFDAHPQSWETTIQIGMTYHLAGLYKELKELAIRNLPPLDDPWRSFFIAEADLMKSKTHRLTGRIAYFYWHANYLLHHPSNQEIAKAHWYDKLKELLEERCRQTPDVRSRIEHSYI